MAVEVKDIVVRKGEEKMSFTSQKDANAHDKMLDIGDSLNDYLESELESFFPSDVKEKEKIKMQEEFCVYLSKNRADLITLLKGLPLKKTDAKK